MHERQYRDYKSGLAKERFEEELNSLKYKKAENKSITPDATKVEKNLVEIKSPDKVKFITI